jgi:putative MATE family efflux protein
MERTRRQNIVYYVVPSVLSSCCFFFFTVVDGIFVGRGVGTDALGAVNLALPFILVINAFTMLITMGGVTITAIRLGRGDTMGANQAFMHSISLISVISALLCLTGVGCTPRLARFLGANDLYFDYVRGYVFWYALFLIPAQIGVLLMGFCRNDGSPRLVTAATSISTGLNIFLDWLFIFPLQKGVEGAAVATGISQVISLAIVASHFVRKKGALRIRMFTPDGVLWRKIPLRGMPEMTAQFAAPVTTFCMNYILITRLGGSAVNAFAIINYVASFFLMMFFGVSEGLQPLFGQSYGAKNAADLKYYFRCGASINLTGSVAIFVMLLFTGGIISRLFGADAHTSGVIIHALPKFSWSFLVAALNTIISSYLYSTKRTKEAILIAVCRGLLFNSVIISLAPALFGASIVWFTTGVAEALALVVAFTLLKHSERGGIVFK